MARARRANYRLRAEQSIIPLGSASPEPGEGPCSWKSASADFRTSQPAGPGSRVDTNSNKEGGAGGSTSAENLPRFIIRTPRVPKIQETGDTMTESMAPSQFYLPLPTPIQLRYQDKPFYYSKRDLRGPHLNRNLSQPSSAILHMGLLLYATAAPTTTQHNTNTLKSTSPPTPNPPEPISPSLHRGAGASLASLLFSAYARVCMNA